MVLSPGAGRTSAAGGLPFWSPACPFTLASILPPSPQPPSPPGKGETKGYFMQGAAPLASPGLNPGGIGFSCGKRVPAGASPLAGRGEGWRCGARRGAQGGQLPADLALQEPGGGAGGQSPAYPAFSFVSAPIPPTPFPSGEGGDSKYISPGATAPGTPATGWEAARAFIVESGFLWSSQLCKGFKALQVWMRHW